MTTTPLEEEGTVADLAIKNGLVVTPQGTLRGGLAVQNERILHIGADDTLPPAKEEIDAGGKIIFPGFIDPHVHIGLGQPRDAAKFETDIRSESVAAAVGGVTTMVTTFQMQLNAPTCLPQYEIVKEIAGKNSLIDYRFTAFVTTEGLVGEIPRLVEEGMTSFKFPLLYAGPEGKYYGFPNFDLGFVYSGFEAIAQVGPPALAMIHAEEGAIFEVLKNRLVAEGRTDMKAWSDARPNICEAIHVLACGMIAIEVGAPLYIVHTSAGESVDAINYLKSKSGRVYGETCPQYIAPLTKHDSQLGTLGKISPPLREMKDAERLWRGIREGDMNTIGSDHGVHFRKDKEGGGLWNCRAGFPGIEVILPIMISEGIHKGRITYEEMARLCAENVARLFGMYPRKGVLSPGSDADIVIIDPQREWTLGLATSKSASDFTVWEGRKVKGKAIKTFVRGKLVAEDGEPVAKAPYGTLVKGNT